jgi:hypothetical protein
MQQIPGLSALQRLHQLQNEYDLTPDQLQRQTPTDAQSRMLVIAMAHVPAPLTPSPSRALSSANCIVRKERAPRVQVRIESDSVSMVIVSSQAGQARTCKPVLVFYMRMVRLPLRLGRKSAHPMVSFTFKRRKKPIGRSPRFFERSCSRPRFPNPHHLPYRPITVWLDQSIRHLMTAPAPIPRQTTPRRHP